MKKGELELSELLRIHNESKASLDLFKTLRR
jgi:hypothetical protein